MCIFGSTEYTSPWELEEGALRTSTSQQEYFVLRAMFNQAAETFKVKEDILVSAEIYFRYMRHEYPLYAGEIGMDGVWLMSLICAQKVQGGTRFITNFEWAELFHFPKTQITKLEVEYMSRIVNSIHISNKTFMDHMDKGTISKKKNRFW